MNDDGRFTLGTPTVANLKERSRSPSAGNGCARVPKQARGVRAGLPDPTPE